MIALLRQIIICVTAASLFSAVVLALVPDNAMKEVVRMATGFVMLLSLLLPMRHALPQLHLSLIPQSPSYTIEDAQSIQQQAILQQTETAVEEYVVRQAEIHHIVCTASVTADADENGVVSIQQVDLLTDYAPEQQNEAALRLQLTKDLGISDTCIRIH